MARTFTFVTRGEALDELRRVGAFSDDDDDLALIGMVRGTQQIALNTRESFVPDRNGEVGNVPVQWEYLRALALCAEALLTEEP